MIQAFKQIKRDINAVFDRDPAARSFAEVLLTYPGIHALILHRLSHFLWRKNWRFLARWIAAFSRFMTGIEIHPAAQIGRCFFIDHGMGVVIGETAVIGDNVTLYHGVTLGGTTWNSGKRHPTLEDGVVVGAGAKILGPFTVGRGAKVGSNAVVVKPVEAGVTVVGTSARVITPSTAETTQTRDYADSIGFQAYGAMPDAADPVVEGFQTLLAHMQEQDRQIETLKDALCRLDPKFCRGEASSLGQDDLPDFAQDE